MQSVFASPKEIADQVELDNFYFFREVFSKDEIEKILAEASKYQYETGRVTNTVDHTYRSSKIKWIKQNESSKWIYDKLATLVKKANDALWKFDLIGFGEDVQIGEYEADQNGHYDWHLDVGKKTCYRKISISVQLSNPDEYEGGELQFQVGRNVIVAPKEVGTAILFPSYFLHRVTPVTNGRRCSLVLWVSGKPFR